MQGRARPDRITKKGDILLENKKVGRVERRMGVAYGKLNASLIFSAQDFFKLGIMFEEVNKK